MKIISLQVCITLLLYFSANAQKPSSPANLKAAINEDGGNIHLAWDKPAEKVAGYNLFVKSGNQEDFLLWGKAGLIFKSAYDFSIMSQYGMFYEFKVCAVQNFPDVIRSELSTSVIIEVPSRFLPMVKINNPSVKKGKAVISWEYNIIASDLHGFILYMDDEEMVVGKEKREHVLDNLSKGKHYVQLVAYSNSGLQSKISVKKFIIIK